MESRKSPKLSRASQEGLRSPRLPTKKPPVRSPSLTRREFSMDGITEVKANSPFLSFAILYRIIKNKLLFMSLCLKHNYLAQVTSNIWGTKFKIVGLASFLPTNLGAGRTRQSHTRCNIGDQQIQQRALLSFFPMLQSSTRQACFICSRDR